MSNTGRKKNLSLIEKKKKKTTLGIEFCSGIWVNEKYIHLAASPNGLIYNDQNKLHGIIEIKCLKIFEKRTTEQLILDKPPQLSKQCFELNDNNLSLFICSFIKFNCNSLLQKLIIAILFCIPVLEKFM